MRRNSFDLESVRYWLFKDRIPLTLAIIISNVVTFIALGLFSGILGPFLKYVAFVSGYVQLTPWTLFTYPFINGCGTSILCFLFSNYWLWVAGGSLERSWGTKRFATFFFLMCAISAIGLYAGGMLLNRMPIILIGLWMPLAGVTIAFAMLNPEQEILFFMIIPLKLKYLALLDVLAVLISYGQSHPLLGVFALLGCAFSYWYVTTGKQYGFDLSVKRNRQDNVIQVQDHTRRSARLNVFQRIRDYKSRKRLEKLFRDSGMDDK